MILIDNYDSFTYNIVQYLKEIGINPQVFKNDKITLNELEKMDFSSIIISPGPGNPDNAGISNEIIKKYYKTKKILGICLGHQCIADVFGGKIIKAKDPCHGKTSEIYFESNELLKEIPQGFKATRYHSLIVDFSTLPCDIKPLGFTKDKILMVLKHKDYPTYGVQFHPEAILTEYGKKIISNFVNLKD